MVRNIRNTSDKSPRSILLGLGLDNDDGHVRVTRGKNFRLLGGSTQTHEQMQEQATRFTEKLDKKGLRLEDIDHDEFVDLAHESGMTVIPEDIPEETQ